MSDYNEVCKRLYKYENATFSGSDLYAIELRLGEEVADIEKEQITSDFKVLQKALMIADATTSTMYRSDVDIDDSGVWWMNMYYNDNLVLKTAIGTYYDMHHQIERLNAEIDELKGVVR